MVAAAGVLVGPGQEARRRRRLLHAVDEQPVGGEGVDVAATADGG